MILHNTTQETNMILHNSAQGTNIFYAGFILNISTHTKVEPFEA